VPLTVISLIDPKEERRGKQRKEEGKIGNLGGF
jgi:hypothetical protein